MENKLWFVRTTPETREFILNLAVPHLNMHNTLRHIGKRDAVVGLSEIGLSYHPHRNGYDLIERGRILNHWKNEISFEEFCKMFNVEPPYSIPARWSVLITEDNADILNKWMHENSKNYKGYLPTWKVYPTSKDVPRYFLNSNNKPYHSTNGLNAEKYPIISFEEFEKQVLGKKEKPATVNIEYVSFLNPTNSTLYRMLENSDERVYDSTGHHRTLEYAIKYYKPVDIVVHTEGKSHKVKRGLIMSAIKDAGLKSEEKVVGKVLDIFTDGDTVRAVILGKGVFDVKDLRTYPAEERLFNIKQIIEMCGKHGISEELVRRMAFDYIVQEG